MQGCRRKAGNPVLSYPIFWCEIAPGPVLGAGSTPGDGGTSEFRTEYYPGPRGRSRRHPNLTPFWRVCYTASCRLSVVHVSDNAKDNPENIGGSSDPAQRPGSIEIV